MKADASPTKDFFVRTITKDISLEDCVFDLVDNCLDGARRIMSERGEGDPVIDSYAGFCVSVQIEPDNFTIEDNCGGISISNAIDYAFRFGRRLDAPAEGDYAIGLYGIGMKRAILKMGTDIFILSSTNEEAFICRIDVTEWLEKPEWEFDLDDAEKTKPAGTTIRVVELYPSVASEFADKTFVNELGRLIARDYSRFLAKGFRITINGNAVRGYQYEVKSSDEFQAYRKIYEDDGVRVEILAGMAAAPPDSSEPTERSVDPEYYGWFILCNDRVVLAADKSDRTVWGDENFPGWHPQYNGFMGMVLFNASEPGKLPWTTTKRDVDETSPLYRRAVSEMKAATQPWISYTNQRKANLEEAKQKERAAKSVPIFEVSENPTFRVPVSAVPRYRVANINYQKPLSDVRKVAKALGNINMTYRTVGERTFDYFVTNELSESEE